MPKSVDRPLAESPAVRSVAVYCGSSSGVRLEYAAAAEELGEALAARGIELVYGGGRVGLMGIVADSVLAHGGQAHGIITQDLLHAEIGHAGLTSLDVRPNMHERKAAMAQRADGFLALPGGFGTLDELCEVLTWTQLGIHRKPVALINTLGYWDHFMAQVAIAAAEGFMKPVHRDLVRCAADPNAAIDLLMAPIALPVPKWLDRSA